LKDYIMQKCGNEHLHLKHMWRPKWYLRRRLCTGLQSDDPWLRANPSLHRINPNAFTKPPHKHDYRLTVSLVLPTGQSVDRNNIYLQCSDPMCWHVCWVNRRQLYKEMTQVQAEQTWPG